ncbi:MAG: hypothetical protein AAF555_06940 [Verrucomicrobiota bacterium]
MKAVKWPLVWLSLSFHLSWAQGEEVTPREAAKRLVGVWQGDVHEQLDGLLQVSRWKVTRRADGTFSYEDVTLFPSRGVYVPDAYEGVWEISGEFYIEKDEEGEVTTFVWFFKKEEELRITMVDEGHEPDVFVERKAEQEKALEVPDTYRSLTWEQMDALIAAGQEAEGSD